MTQRPARASLAAALPDAARVLATPLARGAAAATSFPGYLSDWRRYERLSGGKRLRVRDAHPQLHDRSPSTPFDPHYLHQSVWATRQIVEHQPTEHVDVGSLALFVAMLSVHVPVTMVDIRPLEVSLPGLSAIEGSLERLPFADRSVESLSCLHVVEHVGLGRYGDTLDPDGTRRACAELERVLSAGGTLYLSAPIGAERECFNAHRIHDPRTILQYVPELRLAGFAVVDDGGRLREDLDVTSCSSMRYGCGLFTLERPA